MVIRMAYVLVARRSVVDVDVVEKGRSLLS